MTNAMMKVLTVRLPEDLERRVKAFARPNVQSWVRKTLEASLPPPSTAPSPLPTVDWGAHFDAMKARKGRKKYSYQAGDDIRRRDRERGL